MNRIRSAAELRGRDNIRPSSVIGGGSAEEDLKVRAEAKSIRKVSYYIHNGESNGQTHPFVHQDRGP